MKWGDNARDFDTILAVWPSHRPLLEHWQMQELVDNEALPPAWRDRRVPTSEGYVRLDFYTDQSAALKAAKLLNETYRAALVARDIDPAQKRSLELKVRKALQAKERLQEEEALMLAEARRRHSATSRCRPDELMLSGSERYRQELAEQLAEMPYLKVAMVGRSGHRWSRAILYKQPDGTWSKPYAAGQRSATIAERAKIANGFGFSADAHWGKTKASIRDMLLPRANQLLKLASVQRMLAEALVRGERVIVSNGIVFWYEEEGGIGWQVKATSHTRESDGATLWLQGTIRSTNHGRLVILPYIKENGEHVRGHTKNGPNDGLAVPRHPDQYVDIPFSQLDGDLMIGLFGELPYE